MPEDVGGKEKEDASLIAAHPLAISYYNRALALLAYFFISIVAARSKSADS